MRLTKRRAFLLATVAILAASMIFAVMPAAAQKRTLLVTLLGGAHITVTVDVPPNTALDQVHIPGVSVPIVAVRDVTPPPPTVTTPTTTSTTPTTTSTTPTTPTKTTPEPIPAPGRDDADHAGGKPPHHRAPTSKPKARPKPEAKPRARAPKPKPKATRKKAKNEPKKPRKKPHAPAAAAPAPAGPTFSLATPGPAPLGVPNFFIDRFRVPPFLLSIYQAAGIQYGVPWQVLAAINEIETDYGRNLNISTAGAVGWMQFLPSTWREWGVDANDDGRKDPYNPVDAIFAAARYLKAAGADTDLKRSIFAYNHADWYVQSVLLRARLLGGLPDGLIGSLTGLTQGHFPVAARAKYADDLDAAQAMRRVTHGNAAQPVESSDQRSGIDIYSRRGAPVIATQDGKIVKTGTDARLGHYVVLQDVYGNRYTYGHLATVSRYYAVPKAEKVTPAQVRAELKLPKKERAPTAPATAGVQRADAAGKGAKSSAQAKPHAKVRHAGPRVVAKQRLFAHPARPEAKRHGGRAQLAAVAKPAFTTFKDYFTVPLGLKRKDVELKRLRAGSQVISGAILGRVGPSAAAPGQAPHLHFEIRPAGKGAPRIDPKPILDGWKLLEATAVYRAAGKNPFLGPGNNPSIGQVLLMSKETLEQRVLNDPHIDIYACGRRDIAGGVIDRRVLATLEFLVASGLDPTVSALECGHSYLTSSGNVSEHSSGNAVDIAKINGITITGHQGPGSITDLTIRRLLTLQGTMKPHQIISLMTFRGADNTLSLPDHYNHIHIGFHPLFGANAKLGGQLAAILKPDQWTKLVDRLGQIENPVVRVAPSKFAIKTAGAGTGD
jgi:murein DD-endopeptidase MepM/ murein hydrolase activator NlpD